MPVSAGLTQFRACLFLALCIVQSLAHGMLIKPKPRNAIDSELPAWKDGNAPYRWKGKYNNDVPCACRNGTDVCASAQTCLWMSVGCSIGCKNCDGGSIAGKPVSTNPNNKDRCGSGKRATIIDPKYRTVNRHAIANSPEDWTRYNPWRAPGTAPVFDPCGRASGSWHATPGDGEFTNTTFAKMGDFGSEVLPKYPTGAVWAAGSVVETMIAIRSNHGGGYQYRLCPFKSKLTEACFQATPMSFADDSRLMLSNGTIMKIKSTFVSEGTVPLGSTWQMLPIPDTHILHPKGTPGANFSFEPPCYEPVYAAGGDLGFQNEGRCSGQWINNITIYDQLRVPDHLEPGEYVLGFRWDCETSAQIWQSCADVIITAPHWRAGMLV